VGGLGAGGHALALCGTDKPVDIIHVYVDSKCIQRYKICIRSLCHVRLSSLGLQ
jgi:hypothetical protein